MEQQGYKGFSIIDGRTLYPMTKEGIKENVDFTIYLDRGNGQIQCYFAPKKRGYFLKSILNDEDDFDKMFSFIKETGKVEFLGNNLLPYYIENYIIY